MADTREEPWLPSSPQDIPKVALFFPLRHVRLPSGGSHSTPHFAFPPRTTECGGQLSSWATSSLKPQLPLSACKAVVNR